jgi:phosphoglycolate phosphatase-like HAD superfamily hydrolase
MDPKEILTNLKPEKEFFVGIDSDGCVFDTMEIKQKECFCPNFIKHFNLQGVQKYARETWEFVNLYSSNRGCNRFYAIIYAMELLAERKEVKARNFKLPDMGPVREWVNKETKLGNPALEKYAAQVNIPVINQALAWSKGLNKSVEEMVFGMPTFPFVHESLKKLSPKADLMVVSQTPYEAIKREWEENKIDGFVRIIAGQELGTKSEHIKYGAVGKYPSEKILMVGDALGDMAAAKSNGALFFPINPGHEEDSWEQFYNEAIDKFFAGTYKGAYEDKLIEKFKSYLPELPPWKK